MTYASGHNGVKRGNLVICASRAVNFFALGVASKGVSAAKAVIRQMHSAPVSGEILDNPGKARNAASTAERFADVEDAEYETVSARFEPVSEERPQLSARPQPAPSLAGMTVLADAGASERRALWLSVSGGASFWITSVALIVASFWMAGGYALFMPPAGDKLGKSQTVSPPAAVQSFSPRVIRPSVSPKAQVANGERQ